MSNAIQPYNRALDGGLILKSITEPADAERIAAFNGQIFGDMVAGMTRSLIHHHPASRPDYWLFVEDEATGQIVSSLALIEWTWRYEDVTLKSGEMGIVGTLDSYRNRGLIRQQVARHHELLRRDGFDLSHIQGIPYFYRQFGYEYAMPLEAGWQIELRDIPDAAGDEPAVYQVRRATCDDVPALMRLYDEANTALDIRTVRDEATWRYLLQHTAGTEMEAETWLLLDANQHIVGYWRIALHGFGTGLIVSETSRLRTDACETLLRWLKAAAIEREKPYIRFNLPVSNDLLRAARYRGARDAGTYTWQMHIVDAASLLRKLAPVLERRVAASPFAGLTKTLVINLYREAVELRFEDGKLSQVQAVGFREWGDINLPPLLLAPLVLGYRSREELEHMYPDVGMRGEAKFLADVLFPRLDAFLFTIY